ncbi:hypothetical protein AX16_007275 [Volvariella volvacea WC 439]|nr:hypothetical protein AX16_007275 [Volvariella volvacea WC 439]
MMAKYNFTLYHLAGKLNTATNALSRHVDHFLLQPENQQITLLKEEWFQHTPLFTTKPLDLPNLPQTTNQDTEQANPLRSTLESLLAIPSTIINVKELIKWTPKTQNYPDQHQENFLLARPGPPTRQILQGMYQMPGAEELPPTTLHPHDISQEPWEVISIDVVGSLPKSNGLNAILNIVDHFSKYLISTPVTINLISKQMAEIYRDKVFSIFSVPKKIVSDRGTQFALHFMNDILTTCKIFPNHSTTYHPQTNRQVKKINAEITKYL